MNFEQASEFQKELKQFRKKWPRLDDDLAILKNVVVTLYHGSNDLSPEHIREMFFSSNKGAVLQTAGEEVEVVKVRLDSRDLNRDMLRVVYIYAENTIYLLELYAKKDKDREDMKRINRYIKMLGDQ